jgi:C1A family cysteine protease
VRDQGQLGSCTGFSIAVGLREFLLIKLGLPLVPLSPLFIYYEERFTEHTVHQDAGAQPRDGLRALTKIGVCPEADDPYNIAVFTHKPSNEAVHAAANFKIAAYHRLKTLRDVQTALAGGSGVVMGFKVYESFESDSVAKDGKMPMPGANEASIGGHAVFIAGYQTDPAIEGGGYLIVKNSWSTAWGDNGYFYMPFAYVRPDLVSDLWTGMA